ncbi:Lysophospholipase L1 [Chitinophaga sp. YR627]|uniref:SGNH/GDSL hydrolase family protein n=1 Tax=Chitinophaga sp. YR627 TaxID=1881041 RepID=UPI0008E3347F|nr:SGNH/GDSL hydrolase family protein [Chitinophaga sp. YR627]SFP09595.1 Lysophospholipase L1 [Chitinophaga sp. YR627]
MTPGHHPSQDTTINQFTYLALGDSYTIGESVPENERFPNQTAALLAAQGVSLAPPRIIAKTGWTTDELEAAIAEANVTDTFSIVTLLIGVNNQYRGRSVSEYKTEFTRLLKQAIHFAADHSDRVVVLSIPDWGAVPFAEGRDRQQIAAEIDAFNAVNKSVSKKFKVHYLDVTEDTRKAPHDPGLVASDGLHYSAKGMAVWAGKLAGVMRTILQ